MTLALQDAEIASPGPGGLAILAGHGSGDLMHMIEVVRGPGGEQVRQSDGAESRMMPAALEIRGLKIQSAQFAELFRADAGKFIEQLPERLALRRLLMAAALEWFERLRFSDAEDVVDANEPECTIRVDQMADDIPRAPGAFTFVGEGPGVGKVAQERFQGSGSAGKKCDGQFQVLVHGALRVARMSEPLR